MSLFGIEIDLSTLFFIIFIVMLVFKPFMKKREEQKADRKRFVPLYGPAKSYRRVDFADIEELDKKAVQEGHRTIAVFNVSGVILNEAPARSAGFLSALHVAPGLELGMALQAVSRSRTVSGVFIRFSTPGGTVPGSQYIADGIKACVQANIPVFCFVRDLSASGGVWSMVTASHIIAHPHALLGSVGVIGPQIRSYQRVTRLGDLSSAQLVDAKNIEVTRLYAGKGKALGDPFVEHTWQDLEPLENLMSSMYVAFKQHIALYRPKLTVSALDDLGAAVFNAEKAVALGLVDAVGDQGEAQTALAKALGTVWADCNVLVFEPKVRRGLLDSLTKALASKDDPATDSGIIAAELVRSPVLALSPITSLSAR